MFIMDTIYDLWRMFGWPSGTEWPRLVQGAADLTQSKESIVFLMRHSSNCDGADGHPQLAPLHARLLPALPSPLAPLQPPLLPRSSGPIPVDSREQRSHPSEPVQRAQILCAVVSGIMELGHPVALQQRVLVLRYRAGVYQPALRYEVDDFEEQVVFPFAVFHEDDETDGERREKDERGRAGFEPYCCAISFEGAAWRGREADSGPGAKATY